VVCQNKWVADLFGRAGGAWITGMAKMDAGNLITFKTFRLNPAIKIAQLLETGGYTRLAGPESQQSQPRQQRLAISQWHTRTDRW